MEGMLINIRHKTYITKISGKILSYVLGIAFLCHEISSKQSTLAAGGRPANLLHLISGLAVVMDLDLDKDRKYI